MPSPRHFTYSAYYHISITGYCSPGVKGFWLHSLFYEQKSCSFYNSVSQKSFCLVMSPTAPKQWWIFCTFIIYSYNILLHLSSLIEWTRDMGTWYVRSITQMLQAPKNTTTTTTATTTTTTKGTTIWFWRGGGGGLHFWSGQIIYFHHVFGRKIYFRVNRGQNIYFQPQQIFEKAKKKKGGGVARWFSRGDRTSFCIKFCRLLARNIVI